MRTAKLFKNGKSQAVRLPKEFRFEGEEVFIKRSGRLVILAPKDALWDTFMQGLDQFSEDFMETRQQLPQQNREELFD